MSTVTLKGNKVSVYGELPAEGTKAAAFTLVGSDLSEVSLESLKGNNIVLNIFPSIDTPTCATSVRTFNKKASELKNTKVVCVSKDLPFAHKRFCGAEGIENVLTVSSFRSDAFGKDYGVLIEDGALAGLYARAIVVLDKEGKVIHTELVSEIANEPNYDAALNALK